MDASLLERYREYAQSDEAQAVFFVKKHLARAKGHWVDIVDCRQYEKSPDPLHFRFVVGGLYKRRLTPHYPPKSDYTTNGQFRERDYVQATRAITWETAHKDIEQQISKGVAAIKFEITGVSYDKNRNSRRCFREDAPAEIQALAANPNDRTNPLWSVAVGYLVRPEYVYEVRRVRVIEAGA